MKSLDLVSGLTNIVPILEKIIVKNIDYLYICIFPNKN